MQLKSDSVIKTSDENCKSKLIKKIPLATFIVDEVVHYCVANMPGAVPFTSTIALTNATLPYALQLANLGWKVACRDNLELRKGLNIVDGKVVYKGVSDAFGLPYFLVDTVL